MLLCQAFREGKESRSPAARERAASAVTGLFSSLIRHKI